MSNRADNSVETVVQVPPEMVGTIIARARQGSPASRVADVVVNDEVGAEVLERVERRSTM